MNSEQSFLCWRGVWKYNATWAYGGLALNMEVNTELILHQVVKMILKRMIRRERRSLNIDNNTKVHLSSVRNEF